MRTRTVALTLSLGVLALAGCKSAQPARQPEFLTAPPPGARVIPAPPPETTQPPLAPATAPPSRLPD